MYQIEQQVVEQNSIWEKIRHYIEEGALREEAHEVEENLFRMLLKLGLALLKEVFARHGSGRETETVTGTDGAQIPYHSLKTRRYLSIFGLLEIERAYYWSKESGAGVHPLDARLNLPEKRYSYLLSKWVDSKIAEEPYDEAIAEFNGILGLQVWKHGQEDMVRSVSRDVEAFYRDKPGFDAACEGPILAATADCTGVVMVPSERPKESKKHAATTDDKAKKGRKRAATVTSDFSFKPQKRTPEEMIAVLMKEHERAQSKGKAAEKKEAKPRSPLNKQVFASMTGKADAIRLLADRIEKRDPQGKKPIYVQIDGDPALQNAILDEFEKRGWADRLGGLCLDIMHAMGYVWDAGTALFGEKKPQQKAWVKKQGLALLEGKVATVIGSLRQTITKRKAQLGAATTKVLEKTVTYLHNHRHMMDYSYYLQKGYPIATGVIEGTCGSLVKDRTDRSAMKWTRAGAQAVLSLRALKRNADWDSYWDYHIHKEQQRLYAAVNSNG